MMNQEGKNNQSSVRAFFKKIGSLSNPFSYKNIAKFVTFFSLLNGKRVEAKDRDFNFEKEVNNENITLVKTNGENIWNFSGIYYPHNKTIMLTENSDSGIERHEFTHHIHLNTKHKDDFELENCLDIYKHEMFKISRNEKLSKRFIENLPEDIFEKIKLSPGNKTSDKIDNYINNSMSIIEYSFENIYPEERHSYEIEAHLIEFFGFKNTELICGKEMPSAKFFQDKERKKLESLKSRKENQQEL